jgi:membrane-associated phospholipid phosphatase
MRIVHIGCAAIFLLLSGVIAASAEQAMAPDRDAGTWKTWVISSGKDFRVPPPPDRGATEKEAVEVAKLTAPRDQAALDQIAYWDTGAPSYRWSELATTEYMMHLAIYDAMLAAWDSKYAYNKPHPSAVKTDLKTAVATPPSPSYPAEHAVAAGAASEVLAYLFPQRAQFFRDKAAEAARSRVIAGVSYPSDADAGLALGKKVAALVIERGKSDGTDAKWTGTVPNEPGKWNGTNPVLPTAATWKPWVLSSQSEFRPGPPPAYDSPEKKAELDEIKNFPRTPISNNKAAFWEHAAGGLRAYQYWNELLSKKSLEYRLAESPPRAARAFALPFVTMYDQGIACWDGKYAYWAPRPFMLDPDVKPIVTTPNHPSYPAAHACLSISVAKVAGYLFPRDAETLAALGDEAAESRIWAGIHYRSDIDAGRKLALAVADKVIARAKQDGVP